MKRLLLLLTFTVIGFMLTINASAKTIVTDGLVSYWTFDRKTMYDKTVEDVWGENDATIVGNPTITSGYLIHGLKLDGLGDYVSLPNVGNFGSRIGPYTFEAWLKTSHKRRWSAIFKVNEAPCEIKNIGYGILINAWLGRGFENRIETKEDGILLERSPKRENGCGGSASGRTYPVSDGEWHHIVWTIRKATQEERGDFRDLPDEADCLKSFAISSFGLATKF